jgi:hypothetical protein
MRRPICEFALGYPEFRQKSVHATTTGSSEAVLRFAAMLYGFSPRGSLWRNFRNCTLSHLAQIEFSE